MTTKEARAEWIKALRSGDYEQGQTRLRNNGTYCCLGVACEIYTDLTGDGRWVEVRHGYPTLVAFATAGDGRPHEHYLPETVRRFFGLSSREGNYGDCGEDLADVANDLDGKSFNQIADIIEAEPPGLVVG